MVSEKKHYEHRFNLVPARNKTLTLEVMELFNGKESRKLYLHSRVDPEREAKTFAQKSLPEKNITELNTVFILGLGLGYHVLEIRKLLPAECTLMVFEKEARIHSLCQPLDQGAINVQVNPTDKELEDLVQKIPTHRVQFIFHRPSYDLYPEYYETLWNRVQTCISHKDINIATLTRFERIWLRNFLQNLPLIFTSQPLSVVLDENSKAQGLYAALVGGGPTLTQILPDLKEKQDHIFIACVDTALKPLLDHGIRPDLVFTVDAQFLNALYLLYNISDIPLIAEPTCHPLALRKWQGDIYFFSSPFLYVKKAEEYLGSFGFLKHGGSVSTNAFDFLSRAGFEAIFLVGQDLAFVDHRAHAAGTVLDENLYARETRLHTREKFLMGQLLALPPLYFQGMDGKETFTNQKLLYFKKWFDKEIPISPSPVANTSGKGLPLKNAPFATLPEYGPEKKSHPFWKNFSHRESPESKNLPFFREANISLFLDELKNLVKSITELLLILELGIEKASKLKTLAYNESSHQPGRNNDRISALLKDLDEVDGKIHTYQKTNEILSPVMQKIIQPILEGAKDYLSEEEKRSPLMESASVTLALYQGFKEAMEFSLFQIQKGLLMVADSGIRNN